MGSKVWIRLTALGGAFALFAWATVPRDAAVVRADLDQLLLDLERARETAHVQDEGRLFVLEKLTRDLRESLSTRGLGHAATTRLTHQLILRFRHSDRFFVFIRTGRNGAALDAAQARVAALRQDVGFDEEPFAQVVRSSLEQIHASVAELLRRGELPPALESGLRALVPKLGAAIAVARQGDRPQAFAQASSLHAEIRALYPQLQGLANRSPSYELVLEILGVNEFLGEYAQSGASTGKGTP